MPEPMNEWLIHRLEHIRDAARQACTFVEGMEREDFVADVRTHQACSLNLIIIGEAAKRILDRHPEITDRYPRIRWRQMAGMRNRIAHGYDQIDLDIVWDTITTVLPGLIGAVGEILYGDRA